MYRRLSCATQVEEKSRRLCKIRFHDLYFYDACDESKAESRLRLLILLKDVQMKKRIEVCIRGCTQDTTRRANTVRESLGLLFRILPDRILQMNSHRRSYMRTEGDNFYV